ncbi:hypothetical protein BGW36DRAFT_443104 [Talaromyces proteolyticus]|uniref:Uncharacterized protein n=1 Tax=Talaromyces proteolyticus TaxID=1131652 RepID=A0AAD4PZK5_9EURO|nr:uncharacterized protein BGW36DRAFT_443104 [Talaromyces proteolyticus]KAH8703098.1 hypothetical protein BGW36DRAFT_443104 [Talaromyces proteolyticus]
MPSNFNPALIATQKVDPGPGSASQAGDAKINTSGQVVPEIFDHSMMDYPATIPEQSNEAAPYHNTVADTVSCLATGKGLERLPVKPNTFTVPDWSDSESSNEGAAPPPPLPPSTTTSVSLPEETTATVSNNPLAPSAENVRMTFTGGASADVSVIGEVPGAAEELSGVISAGNFGELPSPSAQKRDMLAAFQEALAFGSRLSRIEEEPPEDSAQKFPHGDSVQVKHATSKKRDEKAVRFLMEDSITEKDFISHLSNPPVEARGTERLGFLTAYTELANKFEEIEETYTINQPEASHSSSTLSSPPTDLDTPIIPQPLPPPPTVHRRSGRERRAPERYDADHEPIQVKRKIKSDRAPKNKAIPNPKPTVKKHERSPIRKKKPTKKGCGARRSAPKSKSIPQQTVSVSSRGRVRLPTVRYTP